MPSRQLARTAAASPDAVALKWNGRTLAYRELDRAATRWADRLRAAGIPPGSVVALSAPPGPQAAAALFGAWRGGYAAAPLHERLAEPEIDHAARLLRPACLVDAGGVLHPVPSSAPSGADNAPGRDAAFRRGVCVFLLTSGSSGSPRAVGIAPDAFAASAAGARRRLDLRPDDCWGLCLSLGHVGGLALLLRAAAIGCAVRCWSSFDAESVASAVAGRRRHPPLAGARHAATRAGRLGRARALPQASVRPGGRRGSVPRPRRAGRERRVAGSPHLGNDGDDFASRHGDARAGPAESRERGPAPAGRGGQGRRRRR